MFIVPDYFKYKEALHQFVKDKDVDSIKMYYVDVMRLYGNGVVEWFHWIVGELYDTDRKKIGLRIVTTPYGAMELRTLSRCGEFDYYMLMSKRKLVSEPGKPPRVTYANICGFTKTYNVV